MAAANPDRKVLRKFLKQNEIFHSDLEKLMMDKGLTNPEEDFKTMTETEFQTLANEAKVVRAQDLKSQQAKVRWEATLQKLEKLWRTASNTKVTSITKNSAEVESQNTAENEQSKLLQQATELKQYMISNAIFDVDLFEILVKNGINNEEEIGTKITSQSMLDEIVRETKVRRTADIKETKARMNLEKKLNKFEKIVRSKNDALKITSITDDEKQQQSKQWPADKQKELEDAEGADIRKWLKENDIWLKELYDGLLKCGVTSPYQIQCLEENEFDEIVRVVRVDRFSNLKDQSARQNIDKMLVRFEKLWRKESGIVKTSITKNTYK
eukprot:CAMPEP_0197061918 /NCGR_PEP_ID=MMETSP1384-20130603/140353_1 /TAXON_ID=29189 /ORGANISM="Ammonia sp." /LENGTH=325 /DNA_ID=CAMNT_0042497681 /DNA_START=76 /DNA_END=1053 /DNA_ORIENTATION=-